LILFSCFGNFAARISRNEDRYAKPIDYVSGNPRSSIPETTDNATFVKGQPQGR